MDYYKIGQKIRKVHGLSQEELAENHHFQIPFPQGFDWLLDVQMNRNAMDMMAVVGQRSVCQSPCGLGHYERFKGFRYGLSRVFIHCDFSWHISLLCLSPKGGVRHEVWIDRR